MNEQPESNNRSRAEAPPAPHGGASAQKRSQPPRRTWLSYGLFALAALLLIVTVALYLRDDNSGGSTIPAAQPGSNQLAHVVAAFEEQGLDPEYARTADRAIGLTELAQPILIGDTTVYVFIYPDPAQRQRDQDRLDPAALQIVNTRSTPVADGVPQIIGGSNVLVAVYSDDADLLQSIRTAIAGMT